MFKRRNCSQKATEEPVSLDWGQKEVHSWGRIVAKPSWQREMPEVEIDVCRSLYTQFETHVNLKHSVGAVGKLSTHTYKSFCYNNPTKTAHKMLPLFRNEWDVTALTVDLWPRTPVVSVQVGEAGNSSFAHPAWAESAGFLIRRCYDTNEKSLCGAGWRDDCPPPLSQ